MRIRITTSSFPCPLPWSAAPPIHGSTPPPSAQSLAFPAGFPGCGRSCLAGAGGFYVDDATLLECSGSPGSEPPSPARSAPRAGAAFPPQRKTQHLARGIPPETSQAHNILRLLKSCLARSIPRVWFSALVLTTSPVAGPWSAILERSAVVGGWATVAQLEFTRKITCQSCSAFYGQQCPTTGAPSPTPPSEAATTTTGVVAMTTTTTTTTRPPSTTPPPNVTLPTTPSPAATPALGPPESIYAEIEVSLFPAQAYNLSYAAAVALQYAAGGELGNFDSEVRVVGPSVTLPTILPPPHPLPCPPPLSSPPPPL